MSSDRGRFLTQVAGRPFLQSAENDGPVCESGNQEHPCPGAFPSQGMHNGDPVHVRHLEIDQRNIRILVPNGFKSLPPGAGLSHHSAPTVEGQATSDTISKKGVVIDHDHGHLCCDDRRPPSNGLVFILKLQLSYRRSIRKHPWWEHPASAPTSLR